MLLVPMLISLGSLWLARYGLDCANAPVTIMCIADEPNQLGLVWGWIWLAVHLIGLGMVIDAAINTSESHLLMVLNVILALSFVLMVFLLGDVHNAGVSGDVFPWIPTGDENNWTGAGLYVLRRMMVLTAPVGMVITIIILLVRALAGDDVISGPVKRIRQRGQRQRGQGRQG